MGGIISAFGTAAGNSERNQARVLNMDMAKKMGAAQQGAYNASAADARVRGGQAAAAAQQRGSQTIGTAKTALAASGVDTQTGSAAEALRDTRMYSALDAQTAKNNAAREAWGYELKGAEANTQAGLSVRQGLVDAQTDKWETISKGASSISSSIFSFGAM